MAQLERQDIISKIKMQATPEPFYKTDFKYHDEGIKEKQEKTEVDLIEEAVEETRKKEKIERVIEETKKRNKDKKTAEDILDELKKKDKPNNEGKKEMTDDEYYESLFKA